MKSLVFVLLLCGICFATEQGAANVGKFLDPDNIENIQKVTDGANAGKTGKEIYKADSKTDAVKDAGKKALTKYQQSKNALMYWVNRVQKTTSRIITKTQNKVNKWRTTLPKLKSYTNSTKHFFGDTYNFMKTFEMSDLWDIDREWSKEFDYRMVKGKRMGLSIWDYMYSRIDDEEYLEEIHKSFVIDHMSHLQKYSNDGYVHEDVVSKFDKRAYFIRDKAFQTIYRVKQFAEGEYSPSPDAPALSKQGYDNRRIKNLLYSTSGDYTDQVSLNQDILNKQYEISLKRSMLQDEIAQLDIYWGALATRKMEINEMQKKGILAEFSTLGNLNNEDLELYMKNKFGDNYLENL